MSQTSEEKPVVVTRPWWVRFALYGLTRRALALACVWLLVWIAALLVFAGFRDLRYSAGAVLVLPAALWYLKAVQWVDKHGGWPAKTKSQG